MSSSCPNRTAASDIPVELWQYISSFLTQEQLKQMYSVNRAFFYISMALRYEELELEALDGVGIKKCFFISQLMPGLKKNIRSLTLSPDWMSEFPIPDEHPIAAKKRNNSKSRSTWKQIWRVLVPRWARKQDSSDVTHYAHQFIGSLECVTRLTVDSDLGHGLLLPDTVRSQAFLSLGWQAFGATLSCLVLKGDVFLFESVLAHSLYLERLETLSVDIRNYRHLLDLPSIFSALSQFIFRHSETLVGLEIVSRMTIKPSWLNCDNTHFPHLRSLKVQQPIFDEPSYAFAFGGVLRQHSDSITDLSWGFNNRNEIRLENGQALLQVPFGLNLPKLERFSVNGYCIDHFHMTKTISFISRHRNTLTNISLASWVLPLHRFIPYINAIASPLIKELDIGVDTLTCNVFPMLADQFPSLEVLRLSYNLVGRQLVTPKPSHTSAGQPTVTAASSPTNIKCAYGVSEFVDDLETLIVGDWPVEILNIRRECRKEEQDGWEERIVNMIAARMPRVEMVNGTYKQLYTPPLLSGAIITEFLPLDIPSF